MQRLEEWQQSKNKLYSGLWSNRWLCVSLLLVISFHCWLCFSWLFGVGVGLTSNEQGFSQGWFSTLFPSWDQYTNNVADLKVELEHCSVAFLLNYRISKLLLIHENLCKKLLILFMNSTCIHEMYLCMYNKSQSVKSNKNLLLKYLFFLISNFWFSLWINNRSSWS